MHLLNNIKDMDMKKFIIAMAFSSAIIAPAYAIGLDADNVVKTTTGINTNVSTEQDSGISLSGKAKIMPHANVSTGDNTATTDIRTSVHNRSDANISDDDTSVENDTTVKNNDSNTRGKGHKYGHNKHN